jgi:hypothetical protein
MCTEKLFKILKKIQDFSSLVHTILFYISIYDEIKKSKIA